MPKGDTKNVLHDKDEKKQEKEINKPEIKLQPTKHGAWRG